MRNVMTILLLLITLMSVSCAGQPVKNTTKESLNDTPEEAIEYYIIQKDGQEASKNLSFIDMRPYKGKILVFYRYNEQYIFQWVESKNAGFITQYGRTASSSADVDNPVDIVGTSGGSEDDEYSATGIYVKDPEVYIVKLVFSNGDIIKKHITEKNGFSVLFEEYVELEQVDAYDNNNNEIWSSSL